MAIAKDRSRKYRTNSVRTLQERVRKSALLLDVQVPNWHKMINTNDFDMGRPRKCVCGYIEKNLSWEEFQKTGLDCLDVGRGFYHPSGYDVNSGSERLRPMWLHQIKKRKAVDAIFRV